MTYEEAEKKVFELNALGWALSMTQSLGSVVEREFSGAFIHGKGAYTPTFCAKTFPELVEVASKAVEEREKAWSEQKAD